MPIKLRRSINLSTPMPQTVVAYGARLMNHRTIGWTTQDPCAEDFHWLSPYTVCGSDPINNVDLDGKKITTIIGNLIYEYINGDDGWGFYKNGKKYEGNNEYVVALLEALKTLQSGEVGAALIDNLVSYSKRINIRDRRPSDSSPNYVSRDVKTLVWSPTENRSSVEIDENGNRTLAKPPAYIVLAHELGHVEDAWSGNPLSRGHITNLEGVNISDEAEQRAVDIENMIRHEHGVNYRMGYGVEYNNQPRLTFYPNYQTARRKFSSKWERKKMIFGFYMSRWFQSKAFE